MTVTKNILTKFKKDLGKNWKEAVINILDCFEGMSDDDGFIKCYWL